MCKLERYLNNLIVNGYSNSESTVWSETVSVSVAMRYFVYRETRDKTPVGFVVLSHLSTDPLESLLYFCSQSNGGSSNPNVEQILQGIRRKRKRTARSALLKFKKRNLESELSSSVGY